MTASPTLRSGLFYSVSTSGDLIVGVNIRDVVAAMPHRPDLDLEFLRAFGRGEAPGDRTPFEGVRRLTPGHSLLPDDKGWQEEFWLVSATQAGCTEGEYVRAFDATLTHWVGREDVIAVAMSGGLDSAFLVGSLAQVLPSDLRIHAFVHLPVDGCQVTVPPGWVKDDGPWVAAVRKYLGDRLVIHEVRNESGILALDVCARQALDTLWPAWNPSNTVWLAAIHRQAAELGARSVLMGSAGNFTFSYPPGPPAHRDVGVARAQSLRSVAKRLHRRSKGIRASEPVRWRDNGASVETALPVTRIGPTLDGYVQRVTAAARPHAAQLAPGNPGQLVTLDPYAVRPILEFALAMGSDGWPLGPLGRAFARGASMGRVPDEVRRRTSRGMQSADTWWSIRHHRDRYMDEAAALDQTVGLRDWVDTSRLRRSVANWPWGEGFGPSIQEVRSVNRVLSLSGYINAMVKQGMS